VKSEATHLLHSLICRSQSCLASTHTLLSDVQRLQSKLTWPVYGTARNDWGKPRKPSTGSVSRRRLERCIYLMQVRRVASTNLLRLFLYVCGVLFRVSMENTQEHWPGSNIIPAYYWSRAGEVPLSAVHSMYFASCLTAVTSTQLSSYWLQLKCSHVTQHRMSLACRSSSIFTSAPYILLTRIWWMHSFIRDNNNLTRTVTYSLRCEDVTWLTKLVL
jgi:hypothetical protein